MGARGGGDGPDDRGGPNGAEAGVTGDSAGLPTATGLMAASGVLMEEVDTDVGLRMGDAWEAVLTGRDLASTSPTSDILPNSSPLTARNRDSGEWGRDESRESLWGRVCG